MKSRDRCELNTRYPNGCTNRGYLVATAVAVILCVGVPLYHFLVLSGDDQSALAVCLERDAGMTEKEHDAALALYFRYEIVPQRTCTVETEILRGCVANDTRVVSFRRYPPGPLRSKRSRDVRASFEHVRGNYLDALHDASNVDANDTSIDATGTDACAASGASLRPFLPRVAGGVHREALALIPPFDALLRDDAASGGSRRYVRYVDYACLAAVEHSLTLLDDAAAWNDAAPAGVGRDFSATLAAFFTHEDFSVGACALTVGAESGECPGEKDTVMGSQKGSDLGYGECDYIEFANVA
tara:strand:- start:3444 stop:4340 length:897 start_codon:yes stop_codon:yes gene_type:complete